jgi:flavin reductase
VQHRALPIELRATGTGLATFDVDRQLVVDDSGRTDVVDTQQFLEAMSRFAGTVTLITTGAAESRYGLTATAVCSLSVEPPSMIACINQRASGHDVLLREGRFAINVLAPRHAHIARKFTGRDGSQGAARFVGTDWIKLATGAPVLADSPVVFDCQLVETFAGFSHSIFVGLVEAVRVVDDGEGCLLWHGREFAMNVKL